MGRVREQIHLTSDRCENDLARQSSNPEAVGAMVTHIAVDE